MVKTIHYSYGVYTGEVNEKDLAHGQGTMKWEDSQYSGGWKNDKCHGHGILSYKNGSSIEGNWEEDYLEGESVFRFPDGSVLKANVHHGYFDDNNNFIGIRQGVFTSKNGDVYTGEINGKLEAHGQGKQVMRDGTVHEGGYAHWKEEGPGTVRFTNGVTMRGTFKDGKMNGHFVIEKGASTFEGDFVNGYIDEQGGFIGVKYGTEKSYDHVYTGEVNKFLQPHGQGQMTIPDVYSLDGGKRTYGGLFTNGKFVSSGKTSASSSKGKTDYAFREEDIIYTLQYDGYRRLCVYSGTSFYGNTPLYYRDTYEGKTVLRNMNNSIAYTIMPGTGSDQYVYEGTNLYANPPKYTITEDSYGYTYILAGQATIYSGTVLYLVKRSAAPGREFDVYRHRTY